MNDRAYEVWCGRRGTRPNKVEVFSDAEIAVAVRSNVAKELNEFCDPQNPWFVWVETKTGERKSYDTSEQRAD